MNEHVIKENGYCDIKETTDEEVEKISELIIRQNLPAYKELAK